MWDEIFGVATFFGLFIAGLIIYNMVDKWKARKANERKNRRVL